MLTPKVSRWKRILFLLVMLLGLVFAGGVTADEEEDEDREDGASGFRLQEVKWKARDQRLKVEGENAGRRATITLRDAASGDVIAEFRANRKGSFEKRISGLSVVPCRVRAEIEGADDESDVERAPSDCNTGDDSGGDTGSDGGGEGGTDSGGYVAGHEGLTYDPNKPGVTCLGCHDQEADDVRHSTHYRWKGDALYMLNMDPFEQGKIAGAVNTYCGNVLGNWNGCSACHIGLGAEPENASPQEELENIDCLMCHQDQYKRVREGDKFVPDTDNMAITMDEAVQSVHKPTRVSCLQCHAKAGGGDAVKRGDLALASGTTADKHYDVHMATSGADLSCQACHTPENHRFPGKGSDLRPTDLDQVVECSNSGCHGGSPHDSSDLNRHTDRVACQTCHIPVYAKDASDTAASEATETHRSWQSGSHHENPPFHPVLTKENDLTPVYRHWNRLSDNTLLGDVMREEDSDAGIYHTSLPDGSVADQDSKLYPFKYKTSDYPLHTESSKLIALDTSSFFADPNAEKAAKDGLSNMIALGDPRFPFNEGDAIEWVTTDTYQLLNHQVSPEEEALECGSCHLTTARMDLQGELGYFPSESQSSCAKDCHSSEKAGEWPYGSFEKFKEYHKKHVREKDVECAECHTFNRM